MPQFFINASDIIDGNFIIKGDDCNHLKKARRIKPGDNINIRIKDSGLFKAIISEVHSDHIAASIIGEIESSIESLNLTLYAGLLKGKLFDFVLQKATEIGIKRIVPVMTRRTIPAINEKKIRWDKIVENAAKQCMRKDIPVVENITSFEDAVNESHADIKIIAHPGDGNMTIRDYFSLIKKEKNPPCISILIGPEGGFSKEELEMAEAKNWKRIAFGFTALRAETASIVIPAIVIHEWSILR